MKVPVRPMPALQCTVIAEKDAVGSLLTACKKVTKEMGDLGTPLSGHEVKWYNRMRRPLLGFESDGEDDEVEEEDYEVEEECLGRFPTGKIMSLKLR